MSSRERLQLGQNCQYRCAAFVLAYSIWVARQLATSLGGSVGSAILI